MSSIFYFTAHEWHIISCLFDAMVYTCAIIGVFFMVIITLAHTRAPLPADKPDEAQEQKPPVTPKAPAPSVSLQAWQTVREELARERAKQSLLADEVRAMQAHNEQLSARIDRATSMLASFKAALKGIEQAQVVVDSAQRVLVEAHETEMERCVEAGAKMEGERDEAREKLGRAEAALASAEERNVALQKRYGDLETKHQRMRELLK